MPALHLMRYRLYTLLIVLLLAAAPVPAPLRAAEPAAAPHQAGPCDQVSVIPSSECAALIAIYNATGGSGWRNRTGWPALSSNRSPCDWHGVVCADGHVVELNLPANRLSGAIPAAFGELPQLRRLSLAGNQLVGPVPPGICTLAGRGVVVDLAYNALFTSRANVRTCLDQLDSDWAATQTVAPREFRSTALEQDAIQLSWNPVAYGGFYEISYATSSDGPFITHGRSSDIQTNSYRLGGLAPGTTYFVRVQTVTPAHPNNPTELRSDTSQLVAVTRATGSILLIVYFPADNDLSPYVPLITERLRLGSSFNPNVRVMLLADQRGPDNTTLVSIGRGTITADEAIFNQWGRRELDTADPAVLAWFLRYARERFPADRTMVALMGHGVALTPEVSWPATGLSTLAGPPVPQNIPALPKGAEATPADVTDRGYLSTTGLGQALAAATDNGTRPFDLLFFDQCFQGSLDTLYEVRSAAEIFIASPNYAWLAAPYQKYLAMLAPSATSTQIAGEIIALYQRSLNDRHPNVIFSLTRADIEATATAVSGLGAALSRAVDDGQRAAIAKATRTSKYVDTTQCGEQNFVLGPPDELIGAGTFALRLREAFPPGDRFGVHSAAQVLLDALTPIRKSVRIGRPYLAPEEFWDYDNTLTILAPLPPDSPSSAIWRSSIYTETMPLTATWTPVPTMTVQVTSSFAFVRDGQWDEFLARWYSTPPPPTVGSWCHYTPPAVVESADPESITLSTTVEGPAVRLNWSATSHQDNAGYWLYVWDPVAIAWEARLLLAPDQTTVLLSDLLPGESYRFQVVAQDGDGAVLARSNEVILSAGGYRIYLPLVGA